MKFVFSFFKICLTAVGLGLAIYLLMAFVLSFISTSPDPQKCTEHKTVFVSSNGVHLFLVLQREHIPAGFLKKLQAPEEFQYASFGWGDKNFYLNTASWNDLSLSTAVVALFWPSPSAMHVSFYHKPDPFWVEVNVCEHQSEIISRYVLNSFEQGAGKFERLKATGYPPNNYFYEARGKYTCFYTSNVWVNEGLKEAAISTSIWSPFEFGVMYQLKN